jgi:hypothetical protein
VMRLAPLVTRHPLIRVSATVNHRSLRDIFIRE